MAPTPAPPAVRQTAADVQAEKDSQRKQQAARQGYASTLLNAQPMMADTAKKTLLGGP